MAFFESSPESRSASGSVSLAGAEQAGEMTASCKMQANMVLYIIISPASVSPWVTMKSLLGHFCSFI